MLMRSQGRAAWRRFNDARAAPAASPAREVLDGVLVIFGGALLLTPGLHHRHPRALFLLSRRRARSCARCLRQALTQRIVVAMTGAAPRRAAAAHDDVEGTAVDVDADRLAAPGRAR